MNKKGLISIFALLIFCGLSCNATGIITPDLGGLNNGINENNYINSKMNEYTRINKKINTEGADKPENPSSSQIKYNFQKGDIDVNNSKDVEIRGGSSLNSSKTIYTDDLGRLHFFGKGNVIKE